MIHTDKYHQIYAELITKKSKGIIFSYDPLVRKFQYRPFSHGTEKNSLQLLCGLMRQDLVFYCYGEDEVIAQYEKGRLVDLERAAQYAYRQRLPHRKPKMDGLLSEVLLDMLIQIYEPGANKLAIRTLFRQHDNNEIKGYDLTYLTKYNGKYTLWLGQAKLGKKIYCRDSIHEDLANKYTPEYFSEQLYFVSDKPQNVTQDSKDLLELIDQLNFCMGKASTSERVQALIELMENANVSLKIPCLLSYEYADLYEKPELLYQRLCEEIDSLSSFYSEKNYGSLVLHPEIVFYIFPIISLNEIRSEKGFYDGLR